MSTAKSVGRTRIQFTEKEDGRLEAVVTMRDLFADFQDIADRYSLPQYRSTMQLALRCSMEHDLLEKEGWTLTKTVKITGIQRWLLTRSSEAIDSISLKHPLPFSPKNPPDNIRQLRSGTEQYADREKGRKNCSFSLPSLLFRPS